MKEKEITPIAGVIFLLKNESVNFYKEEAYV